MEIVILENFLSPLLLFHYIIYSQNIYILLSFMAIASIKSFSWYNLVKYMYQEIVLCLLSSCNDIVLHEHIQVTVKLLSETFHLLFTTEPNVQKLLVTLKVR